jgi:hypothetical protein
VTLRPGGQLRSHVTHTAPVVLVDRRVGAALGGAFTMNLHTTLKSTRTALTAVAVAVVTAACLGASATTTSADTGQHGSSVTHATKEYKARGNDVTVATKEYKVVQSVTSKTKEW